MADTKNKIAKLGDPQLRARAEWNAARLGPLAEPVKMGRLEFAARLSQTQGGRRKTVGAVAADVVEIFTAAHDCALSSRHCPRAVERLENLLTAYGAILTKAEGAAEILFCIGPVGFLCAPDLDTDESDIMGLRLAATLAREFDGRYGLSSEIANDAVTLMRASTAAKNGNRSAYGRARAVCRKYGAIVYGPEEAPGVALCLALWSGGDLAVA
ncbi:hypothetical protein [Hyphomicrobium sp.]|uniref:hypothetical protein n=1 Tax=Hyphomicrobium sp. TaxID=82 RepID=UPI002C0C2E74|nr:hypothetical protein [Hyphomicrobium sp.]HRQ25654.1 hypothetical protein [Hyphomicrobium sp.]